MTRPTLVRPARIFYGWWIVLIGVVSTGIAGGFFFIGFSVYFLPLTRDLKISQAATALPLSFQRVIGGVEGPFVGLAVDRWGPGRVMFLGALAAGLGFILLSFTRSYAMFLLVFLTFVAMGFSSGFGHTSMTAINSWFIKRRGLAMAMMMSGIGVGGAILTPLVVLGVEHLGWRTTIMLSGISICVVVTPLSFFLKRSPESMGLRPDGEPDPAPKERGAGASPAGVRAAYDELHEFPVREALKTPAYWMLGAGNGMRIAVFTGITVLLVPILVWRGLDERLAGFLLGFMAFGRIPTGLVAGYIGDHWHKQRVIALGLLTGAVGMLVLLLSQEPGLALIFLIIAMFSVGEAMSALSWALVGDFFGRRNFATLRGGLSSVQSLLSFGVPVYTGWVYDTTQSYDRALAPFTVILFAASAIYWFIPRPRRSGAAVRRLTR